MDDDLAKRSHQLLMQAIEMDTDDRRAFVEAACAQDSRLRNRLPTLLAALEDSQCFLEKPALQAHHIHRPVTSPLPRMIGNYRIVRVIGSGGMATVYEAIQAQPERRVALKVPHQAWHDTSTIHRFRYELSVLARLQHPNIAQIYEAGVWEPGSGITLPFFAMEFVVGASAITDFVRQHKLGTAHCLDMFATVCDAVHYGHRHGVIHRDLKPANILVDHEGRPKIIDFGVARSTDPNEHASRNGTDVGQLIGTLNFMSPEQCISDGDVDARTDVYSLGVVLYALVCKRLPHDLAGVPLPEALRIVQQDAPRRPAAVAPQLRGDLDAVILKAIEKDPQRRYPSVDAFGADIRRLLNHQTVEARAPTILYQCQMFARRNRMLVVSAIAVLAAILLGSIFSTVFAVLMYRESQLRLQAQQAAVQQRDEAVWKSYIANIAGAFSALQTQEYQQLRNRLASAPELHRGWEWRFLSGMAEITDQTIHAHDDMILGFAMHPSTMQMVTSCRDGSIRLWNTASGDLLADLSSAVGDEDASQSSPVRAVAFSVNGDYLVSGADNGSVRIWDVRSGESLRQIDDHRSPILHVSCAPGDIVAVASQGGSAQLWHALTGEHLRTIDDEQDKIHGVAFSADGSILVTWTRSGAVFIRSGDGRTVHHRFSFGGNIDCLDISADRQWVAAGGGRAMIVAWNTTTGESREFRLPNQVSTVRSIKFSPDGKTLTAGQVDRCIVLWRVEDGTQMDVLRGHEEAVSGLGFSAGNRQLFSASWDRTIRAWNLSTSNAMGNIAALEGHTGFIYDVQFSPDGRTLASGSADRLVRLSDPELGKLVGVLRGHRGAVMALAYSPREPLLATGATDRTVRLWHTTTGQLLDTLGESRGAIWTVAFSPDGRWLAAAGDDRTVRIWDVSERRLVHALKQHESRVIKIAFSPHGTQLASTSRDQKVIVWDTDRGEILHRLVGHQSDVFAAVYHPDGTRLYTGSRDQTVRVWDPNSGDCLDVLTGHGQFVTDLAINPAGTRLVAGSWFGEIVLWDLPSHDIVASFKGHGWAIRGVSFSPDGRFLASGAYDQLVRVYDECSRAEQLLRRAASEQADERARVIVRDLFDRHEHPDAVAAALDEEDVLEPGIKDAIRKHILHQATIK